MFSWMGTGAVRITQRETIHSGSSPKPPQKLNSIDKLMPRVYPFLLFHYQDAKALLPPDRLTSSFRAALSHFPLLSGRLQGHGSAPLHVSQEDQGALLLFAVTPETSLETPGLTPGSLPAPGDPLMVVQVTYMGDGAVVIGLGIHHCVADARSDALFMKCWSSIFRGGDPLDPLEDRSLLTGDPLLAPDFQYQGVVATPYSAFNDFLMRAMVRVLPRNMFGVKHAYMEFSAEKLEKLKRDFSPSGEGEWISTNDALCALIWRCATRARGTEQEKIVKCCIAIDLRSKMDPPLPENYFGNAANGFLPSMSVEALTKGDPSSVAKIFREVINSRTDEENRKMLAWIERQDPTKVLQLDLNNFLGTDLSISNWSQLGHYSIDFGVRRPKYVGNNKAEPLDGVCFFLEAEKEGSLVVYLGLKAPHMEALLQDPELLNYMERVL